MKNKQHKLYTSCEKTPRKKVTIILSLPSQNAHHLKNKSVQKAYRVKRETTNKVPAVIKFHRFTCERSFGKCFEALNNLKTRLPVKI